MKKFLILFFSAVFATSLAAQDTYTLLVENSTVVEYYWTVFNFIASLFQSGDYLSLLKLFAIFGGTMAMVQVVLSSFGSNAGGGIKNFAIYMATITGLLVLVGGNYATVVVKTNDLGSTYYSNYNPTASFLITPADASATGVVIANVPSLFAYTTKFLNRFNEEINRLYSMGMSTESGYNLGSYAKDLKDSMSVLNTDLNQLNPGGSVILRTFLKDCIAAPAALEISSNGGLLTDTMTRTGNIYTTLNSLITANELVLVEKGLSTTIASDFKISNKYLKDYLVDNGGLVYQCSELWSNISTDIIPNAKSALATSYRGVGPGAVEILSGQANVPVSNFEEIAIQAGLVSMYSNVNSALANENINYAAGKTRAEFIQSNIGNGYYMASMLPTMQSFFRILMYALFPMIFAVSLMPGGVSIIKEYLKSLFWIELWSPIAAVLNYAIAVYAEQTVAGDITTTSALKMYSDTASFAGVAGYMYLSVPALSWLILKGSAHMLSGMGAGLAAKMNANVTSHSMAQDHAKITKQRADQMARSEVVSMASQDMEAARNQAYNDFGQLQGYRNFTGADISNSSNLGVQTPIKSVQEQLKVKGSVNSVSDLFAKGAKKDIIEKDSNLNYLGNDMEKVAESNGVNKGIEEKSNKTNLDTFGSKTLQNVADNTKIEGTQTKDTRFSEIGKKSFNIQDHAELSAKNDYNLRENPTLMAADQNGDGKLTDKEIYKGAKTLDNQAKMDLMSKDENQAQLIKSANDYKNSSNGRVSQAAEEGQNSGLGELGAAVRGQVASKTVNETFNNVKDSKNVMNLEGEMGKGASEEVANVESKDTIKKVSQAKSETNTLGNVLPEVLGQYNDVRNAAVEQLESKGYTEFEAKGMADRALIKNFSDKGIAVAELTERALTNDLQAVNIKEQNAIKAEVAKVVTNQDRAKVNLYEHQEKRYNQALAAGDTKQAAVIKEQFLDKMESNDLKQIQDKINGVLNSDKVKSIQDNFNNERNKVIGGYVSSGLVSTSNGKVEYLDTAKMLNSVNLSQEQKMFMTNQIKGGLDGLKTDMVDLKGMERKFVQDINGNNTTDISKAEISYIKTGNFEHGIMYEAGKSETVNNTIGKDGLAIVQTGFNYASKASSGIYGIKRFLQ
ncbi:conjugal transfer protein TraG N-terminal domain-containing protein [Aliarcobacter butzleri]|uniref:conjugal transfer protein TraG N-terminal domain-containing protein n=1 Tax=Aliarcobacter butzleri TaxID=28197 RepID=UPI00344F2B2C